MSNTIEGDITSTIQLLKALANTKRLEILYMLHNEGEKSVSSLMPNTGLSQSALSQHLARLREYGLVKTRRNAQTIYYSIKCPKLEQLLTSIKSLNDNVAQNIPAAAE